MEVKMKTNRLIKTLIMLILTTNLEAKETPFELSITIPSSVGELVVTESAIMTPLEMLSPVSFDSSYFLDYSTVIQMLWY
jgi:hypothetical protein